jgi:hypothetical protein
MSDYILTKISHVSLLASRKIRESLHSYLGAINVSIWSSSAERDSWLDMSSKYPNESHNAGFRRKWSNHGNMSVQSELVSRCFPGAIDHRVQVSYFCFYDSTDSNSRWDNDSILFNVGSTRAGSRKLDSTFYSSLSGSTSSYFHIYLVLKKRHETY